MVGKRMRGVVGLCGALGFAGTLAAAEIAYVADGSSGEYCGVGYGIAVSVSAPTGGYTVEYSEAAEGPWSATPVTYKDVCTERPVYFRISAPGYGTVVDSRNVTVTPKPLTEDCVWYVYPPEAQDGYVYDGTPKEPEVDFGDGEPSILTEDDFTVTYEDNVDAGTARIVFTGKNNYAGTVVEEFEILKRKVSEDGTEPGEGEVPEGGLSKFDVMAVYDGEGHTIDTNRLVATFAAVMGEGTRFEYGLSAGGDEGVPAPRAGAGVVVSRVGAGVVVPRADADEPTVWSAVAPAFTNAGEAVIWYRVTKPNYEAFVKAAKVTIAPRDIANVTVAEIADQTATGSPVEPEVTVTDGEPSIVTADDYEVAYSDNVSAGTATVTLVGRRNYAGTKTVTFAIVAPAPQHALLTGTLAWKLNLGTGCYTAQLTLTCTNGFDAGIGDLRFVYQDRMRGAETASALWDSAARPETTLDGTAYRYVDLDASLVAAQDVPAVYGVRDVSQARGVVPRGECAVELYVRDLAAPVADLGYVTWTSGGAAFALPLTAAGGAQGMAVGTSAALAGLVRSAPRLSAPLSADALDASAALGVVLEPGSEPYCRVADFAVGGGAVTGRVEVGKRTAGAETRGALGANARVVVLGARDLADGFVEIGSVAVGDDGAFRFGTGDGEWRFFRVRVEVGRETGDVGRE